MTKPDHAFLHRIGLAILAASVPTMAVMLGLVLAGALSVPAAIGGALALSVLTGILFGRDLDQIDQAIRNIDSPVSRAERALFAREVLAAIGDLGGRLRAERLRQTEQADTAEAILDSLPDPVLLLSSERTVLVANNAAVNLLGTGLVGRDLALSLRHPAILDAVGEVFRGLNNREVEFSLPVPLARDFSARVVGLPASGEARPAILTLHDLTAVKRAEQMRADFVANASHELRTPLATLIGFIETLQGPARDDADARTRFLGIMQEQAGRMARLIRDLLSLSQIELNEHTAPRGQVDLKAVLESVIAMLQIQATAKGVQIELDAPDGLPPAIGDRDELIQVFQNLIDNAIKYGRQQSTVQVTLRAQEGGAAHRPAALSVAIADQGEGIPREHLPRLTERFYRVDSARSRALGGTGLGLAIVKHIVNRHRGSLTIDSAVGQGSTFTIFIPAHDRQPGAAGASVRGIQA